MGNILEIKRIPTVEETEKIIGNYPLGGVVEIDGSYYWLRHPRFRWNGKSFGWENDGFSKADISEVGYWLIPYDKEITKRLSEENLFLLKEGILPLNFTIGVEIEGCLYDKYGNLMQKHDGRILKVEEDQHPELLAFTVETSTKPNNGRHLACPIEIAQALSNAVLDGYKIAQIRDGMIVYSSVPEAGNFFQCQITPHPYLLSFAPKVLNFTIENWHKIPREAKEIYNMLGIDIFDFLQKTNILNWPVNALHVHNGIPEIDYLADPRIAYAYGVLRQTEIAKIFSFLLYNTSFLYGINTGLKDVRSIIRRLLATTTDGKIPSDSQSLINGMIEKLVIGEIHSPSRYPATGQHDRVRFRAEKQYKTVESIDAPMVPDLRLVLGWIFFNQILNVIALEAISQTNGDESEVIDYLKQKFGNIFSVLPTMGENSCYSYDLIFNKFGLDGSVNGTSFRKKLLEVKKIVEFYGNSYRAIQVQSAIVSHLIEQALSKQNSDLNSFLGFENGRFIPNRNTGLITDAKKGLTLQELIEIQSIATKRQAEQLFYCNDLKNLLSFFGLKY